MRRVMQFFATVEAFFVSMCALLVHHIAATLTFSLICQPRSRLKRYSATKPNAQAGNKSMESAKLQRTDKAPLLLYQELTIQPHGYTKRTL